jgi:hypothetical protein
VSLFSEDAELLDKIIELHLMAILLSRPTAGLLTAVLPRLLRDPRLCLQFCEQGGVAHLHRIVVFEQNTEKELAGCVAVIELLARDAVSLCTMLDEEGFVASVVSLLSSGSVTTKTRVHVVRGLMSVALNAAGAEQAELSLVPLMESLMTTLDKAKSDPDTLALSCASLELMALLCNNKVIPLFCCFVFKRDDNVGKTGGAGPGGRVWRRGVCFVCAVLSGGAAAAADAAVLAAAHHVLWGAQRHDRGWDDETSRKGSC